MEKTLKETKRLLKTLKYAPSPFGIHYTDHLPKGAIGPDIGEEVSLELEKANKINWERLDRKFVCFIRSIWVARKKKTAAFMSKEKYGCVGGMFFTGFLKPGLAYQSYFVSTGIPGTDMPCERYMPTPESMALMEEKIAPSPPPAKYLVAKPLTQFDNNEKPEFVILFARPDLMAGIVTLLTFTSGEVDCVRTPFGAGCCHILAWPRYYKERNMEVGVLGTFDPGARLFYGADELSLTLSMELYEKMLAAMDESFFRTDTWDLLRNKAGKSAKIWGELDDSTHKN